MRLFGLEINRAAAPLIRRGSNNLDTSIVQAPPEGSSLNTSRGDRIVSGNPFDIFALSLPSKLAPSQVVQILRAALAGDLWQVWALTSLMLDSWPMFRKCSHELREAVSQASFKVEPFAEDGEEPTQIASDKAALVRRAMAAFNPDPFSDEEDLTGAIYDFCDAMLCGITLSEILWQQVQSQNHGIEFYPKSICWVHPRNFKFASGGRIMVMPDAVQGQVSLSFREQVIIAPDPKKFICSQFKSRSGSSLAGGLMRPLAWYWSGKMFGREWRLKNAQVFGAPFVDVTYKPGTQPAELARLDAEISSGLANRFIRHVEGTTVNVTPGRGNGANDIQKSVDDDADQQCCYLLLGQEGTTKSTPGKLGGKNEDKEHGKRERVEGLAKWVARESLQQLAAAILMANYGEATECPTIEPDFTEIEDPMEAAQRMQIICAPGMPPIIADEFYGAMKLTKPEQKDQVILAGKIGLLGDTETPIEANPQEPEPVPPVLDENNNPMPARKLNENDVALQMKMAKAAPASSTKATFRGTDLQTLLGKASNEDLEELQDLVHAAEVAPHKNGESAKLKAKLKELSEL